MEKEENFASDLASKKAVFIRKIERLLVKIAKSILLIEEQIVKSKEWKAVEHEAILLQANLYRYKPGLCTLEVQDWEKEGKILTLQLDPLKNASEQISEKVRKSRKLQRGIIPLQKHLEKLQSQKEKLLSSIVTVQNFQTLEELFAFEAFMLPAKKEYIPKNERKKSLPYHQFWSASGLKIFVGKKARGNGFVTFNIAKGNDFWFHAAGVSGAHVVLQSIKKAEPDSEALLDALQIALAHSNTKDLCRGDVMCTQRKFLQPLGKKELGKVQVSKHKVYSIKRDLERLDQIKKRKGKEPGNL